MGRRRGTTGGIGVGDFILLMHDDTLTGFIRVQANTLDEAKCFVPGNPVYECGGTVEVRALPED